MRFFRRPRAESDDLSCQQAVELVAAYLDGALPAARTAQLERHLASCPHCTEYVAQLRVTIDAAGRVPVEGLAPETRLALIRLYRQTRAE